MGKEPDVWSYKGETVVVPSGVCGVLHLYEWNQRSVGLKLGLEARVMVGVSRKRAYSWRSHGAESRWGRREEVRRVWKSWEKFG